MDTPYTERVVTALSVAEREVARALGQGWLTPDGTPAHGNLLRLQEQLRDARQRAESGENPKRAEFAGLVRWVTDWIPSIDHPLVAALGNVERTTQHLA